MTTAVTDVVMPRLSDAMEEGTIIAWLAQDGASVDVGDELVEIETDKATMTYEAETAGVLRIVAELGATVPVGAVIAQLGSGHDDAGARAQPPAAAVAEAPIHGDEPRQAPEPAIASADGPVPAAAGPTSTREVLASPVARRVAGQLGIDLETVTGSGPRGRIVRADVERTAGIEPAKAPAIPGSVEVPSPPIEAPPPVVSAPGPTERSGAKGEVTIAELTRLQQVVARRMAESKATAPEFVIGVDVDMEEAIALREQLKAIAGDEKPPSYNDFIVKACALALREYPRANGAYRDGRFELFSRINVGVAVAANDALVVPTIFDADRRSLGEIGRESRELAKRVREGTITPPELSGGTFTVSNLGMFGIAEFIAVINPPQAAILSVGEMRRQPVEHQGEIALRHIVKLKLTCDHRILYGADAAGFLGRIRELLEKPLAMSL